MLFCFFFFFNDTATTEIYTLSLHDALPIFNNLLTIIKSSTDLLRRPGLAEERRARYVDAIADTVDRASRLRSEEHTSELQSRQYLVCRLLLEKKKKTEKHMIHINTTT